MAVAQAVPDLTQQNHGDRLAVLDQLSNGQRFWLTIYGKDPEWVRYEQHYGGSNFCLIVRSGNGQVTSYNSHDVSGIHLFALDSRPATTSTAAP